MIDLAGRVHDGTADVALDEGHGLVDLILDVALEIMRIKNLHTARLERTGVVSATVAPGGGGASPPLFANHGCIPLTASRA